MFDALTSFTYNLGIGNLKRSTLLRKLNREDYEGAAREFKRWNRAGGKVYRGLTSRRLEEEELFRKDL
jgi:GH24 family phage-related lysozyme (muramidase)